jgi:hypothetical protein
MTSFILSITCLSFSSGFRTWFKIYFVYVGCGFEDLLTLVG